MCLYLSLSALHVSDSLVHHQERRFGAVYRSWAGHVARMEEGRGVHKVLVGKPEG